MRILIGGLLGVKITEYEHIYPDGGVTKPRNIEPARATVQHSDVTAEELGHRPGDPAMRWMLRFHPEPIMQSAMAISTIAIHGDEGEVLANIMKIGVSFSQILFAPGSADHITGELLFRKRKVEIRGVEIRGHSSGRLE